MKKMGENSEDRWEYLNQTTLEIIILCILGEKHYIDSLSVVEIEKLIEDIVCFQLDFLIFYSNEKDITPEIFAIAEEKIEDDVYNRIFAAEEIINNLDQSSLTMGINNFDGVNDFLTKYLTKFKSNRLISQSQTLSFEHHIQLIPSLLDGYCQRFGLTFNINEYLEYSSIEDRDKASFRFFELFLYLRQQNYLNINKHYFGDIRGADALRLSLLGESKTTSADSQLLAMGAFKYSYINIVVTLNKTPTEIVNDYFPNNQIKEITPNLRGKPKNKLKKIKEILAFNSDMIKFQYSCQQSSLKISKNTIYRETTVTYSDGSQEVIKKGTIWIQFLILMYAYKIIRNEYPRREFLFQKFCVNSDAKNKQSKFKEFLSKIKEKGLIEIKGDVITPTNPDIKLEIYIEPSIPLTI